MTQVSQKDPKKAVFDLEDGNGNSMGKFTAFLETYGKSKSKRQKESFKFIRFQVDETKESNNSIKKMKASKFRAAVISALGEVTSVRKHFRNTHHMDWKFEDFYLRTFEYGKRYMISKQSTP